MKLLRFLYEKFNHKTAPYYYDYSLYTIISKPIRKFFTNTVAASCPFNCLRIAIYKMCGFKIGKNVFIGMRCYLDDMCYDSLSIGSNVVISYGVYFACHGIHQTRLPIIIEDNAYIGMRASIISGGSRNTGRGIRIGQHSIVGSCSLVNKDVAPYSTAVGVPCRIIKPLCGPLAATNERR